MDVVVKGRHCEVSDGFRDFVTEKLSKLERYDHHTLRVDVEIDVEPSPQLPSESERVQLTAHSRGPVIRVEASAGERHAAFDLAFGKLEAKLRKAADRRRIHYGARRPESLAEATRTADAAARAEWDVTANGDSLGGGTANDTSRANGIGPGPGRSVANGDASNDGLGGDVTDASGPGSSGDALDADAYADSPVVVREKTHAAQPMTLDQALYEMELVGHDFFLFVDDATKSPSVVYRRRAFDYGVIHLDVTDG